MKKQLFISLVASILFFTVSNAQVDPPCVDNVIDFESTNVNFEFFQNDDLTLDIAEFGDSDYNTAPFARTTGLDPLLLEISTAPNVSPINAPTTNGSSRGIRINQNFGYWNNGSDEAELDKLRTTFEAQSCIISFDYFVVFEQWLGDATNPAHTTSEQPYLAVKVSRVESDGTIFDLGLGSTIVRANSSSLRSFNDYSTQLGDYDVNTDLRYASIDDGIWRTETIDIGEDNIGEIIQLEISVRDCSEDVHGGYAYIDNISNCINPSEDCSNDIPGPCDTCEFLDIDDNNNDVADAAEFSITSVIGGDPCINKYISRNTECDQLTSDWIVEDPNGMSNIYDGSGFLYNFVMDGIYTITHTISLIEGCSEVYSMTYSNDSCSTDPDCPDCDDIGDKILNSIEATDTCGEYTLFVEEEFLECYEIVFNSGEEDSPNITITESGEFVFTYTENGGYSANITLINIETGNQCYFNKKALNVDCFSNPDCSWPKVIGTNNPLDIEGYHSEYIAGIVEDDNDNIIALGRARIGANIEGTLINNECYIAKYSPDGCILDVFEIPTINYPLKVEILNNNDLIVLSSQDNLSPFLNDQNQLYLDKLDSDGNSIWRISILTDQNSISNITMTLNTLNNDIYLNVPFLEDQHPQGSIITDAFGNDLELTSASAILRFNTDGLLTWNEQISSNPRVPFIFDIDFDEQNNLLLTSIGAMQGQIVNLETSNFSFQVESASFPMNGRRNVIIKHQVNPVSGIINYDSHFFTGIEGIATNSLNKSIVSNGTYIYTANDSNFGGLTIFDLSGNLLVNYNSLFHSVLSIKHVKNTNDVILTGNNIFINGNHGVGLSRISNLNTVWNEHYSVVNPNGSLGLALGRDITVTSNNKVFLAGSFSSLGDGFGLPIGGHDGFIRRFTEENGTIIPEFTDVIQDKSLQKQVTSYSLFPNPSTGSVTINSLKKDNREFVSIRVLNYLGREVYAINKGFSRDQIELDLNRLPTGLYFVEIVNEIGTKELHKLIIRR